MASVSRGSSRHEEDSLSVSVRRLLLMAATLATTVTLCYAFWQPLEPGGVVPLKMALMALFVVLAGWVSLWFWLATAGFWIARRHRTESERTPVVYVPHERLPRTAILMPIYNEEAGAVFARIQAMVVSIAKTGHAEAFDLFVLSDTTDPDVWLEEEWLWLRLHGARKWPSRVYYRRRAKNIERKAGNIADFCTRWGAQYRYMVTLDADSLIDGAVLVEMVRRMEADPRLGILQTPPLPLGDKSILSRCQQFAAKLCGPLLAHGFEYFAGDAGNYWGHNAIIRTLAFTRHCGMSKLPGDGPLGGEILSHDFVEAALMRRAGYKVQLASDLAESYEQSPTTLPQFAQRDQRWCQGNLQHARLVVSRRIPWINRFHFTTGILTYVSSPLWLLFIVAGLAVVFAASESGTAAVTSLGVPMALAVFVSVMAMLLLPRLWGVLLVIRDPSEAARYGGTLQFIGSTLFELAVSVVMAPIMMAFHSVFVVTSLAGRRIAWNAQSRDGDGVTWAEAWRVHWWQTVAGLVAGAIVWSFSPLAFAWLTPVLFGLVFAPLVSMAISSARVGVWFAKRGLLLVPEELQRPEVVQSYLREMQQARLPAGVGRGGLFKLLLHDPIWLRSHFDALASTDSQRAAEPQVVQAVATRLAADDWEEITKEQQRAVLCDPVALSKLHRRLWLRQSVQWDAANASLAAS